MVCHNSTTEGGITYQSVSHACSLDCIAALKAKLEERGAGEKEYFAIPQDFWEEQRIKISQSWAEWNGAKSEPTKPERWPIIQDYIQSGTSHSLITELRRILRAQDKVTALLNKAISKDDSVPFEPSFWVKDVENWLEDYA
jgi:hypothetical protein